MASAVEAAELDRDRALFWLDAMARGMDDESILRTFVSRVVLDGPDGGDGLRIAFKSDSPSEGGDLALGASRGGEVGACSRNCASGPARRIKKTMDAALPLGCMQTRRRFWTSFYGVVTEVNSTSLPLAIA